MKKNDTLGLVILLIICFFSSLNSNAQTPVANNDTFITVLTCSGSQSYPIMSNDVYTGNVSNYQIDLNPSQPGVQQSIYTITGFYQASGISIVASQITPAPNGYEDLTYTIQDNVGNVSNQATIRVFTNSPPINLQRSYENCQLENGGRVTYTFNYNAGLSDQVTLNYYDTNWTLLQSHTIPPFSPSYTVSNLAPGTYYTRMTLQCGLPIQSGSEAIIIKKQNPLLSQITPTYNDYNADGIVNVGDIVNYQVNVTNTSTSCVMNNITIVNGGSAILSTLGGNGVDNSTLNFYKVITQDDINAGRKESSFYHTVSNPDVNNGSQIYTNLPLNTSNGIKLNAFIDGNNNGIQDASEQNYNQGTFSYAINSGALHHINTNNGVHYLYETNPANVYDLHYNIDNNFCGTQYLIAQPNYSNVTVADGSGVTTYNFAITPVSCQDLSVQLYNNLSPRPGFVYSNTMVIKNEGNQTASGNVSFQADSTLSLISNSVNAIQTANGFTYNVTNMVPGETRYITILMQVPTIPTVGLGQTLTNTATIANTDANAANNSASLTSVIIGSYDPNEKTEAHGGKIVHSGFTADDYLTYTIRFENTGTAEAINIRVDDVLDNKLDESSIKMIRASHNYTLDRIGNHLTWRFDGVNLPPSVAGDDVTGHGYVVFQVKPKAGFALGDIIPNSANIYFDFNPAIVTNTCTTEFVPFLGVDAFAGGSLEYYPNPTTSTVNFSMKNAVIDTLEITDILGKTLLQKTVQNHNTTIDLSGFKSGVYFARLSSGAQEKTVKLIRQ